MKKYEDVITMPHFHPANKPYMSNHDRAAQFMPFKSLSTHENAIIEKQKALDNAEWETIEPDYDIINQADL